MINSFNLYLQIIWKYKNITIIIISVSAINNIFILLIKVNSFAGNLKSVGFFESRNYKIIFVILTLLLCEIRYISYFEIAVAFPLVINSYFIASFECELELIEYRFDWRKFLCNIYSHSKNALNKNSNGIIWDCFKISNNLWQLWTR